MRKNLLILLLLLVSSCMWGQHSPSVRGYVWDYFNEKPLVGAKVVLWQGDSLAIDSVVTDSKAPGEYNFIINKMGQYSVTASLKTMRERRNISHGQAGGSAESWAPPL